MLRQSPGERQPGDDEAKAHHGKSGANPGEEGAFRGQRHTWIIELFWLHFGMLLLHSRRLSGSVAILSVPFTIHVTATCPQVLVLSDGASYRAVSRSMAKSTTNSVGTQTSRNVESDM